MNMKAFVALVFTLVQYECFSFTLKHSLHPLKRKISTLQHFSSSQKDISYYKPREGLGQKLLDLALSSPLWEKVMVPQARKTMVKTAEANSIPWSSLLKWIESQGPWDDTIFKNIDDLEIPEYYRRSFHAYKPGNLCFEAAFEQEIASASVGARNFPKYGNDGEDAFRSSFESALNNLLKDSDNRAMEKVDGVIVDLGCGTGTSTRRLAELYPNAKEIIGIDLSPYFITVGQRLLEIAPRSYKDDGEWVNTITPDNRIKLKVADAAKTGLSNESVSCVNVQFLFHEMPLYAIKDVIKEAHRILTPGGTLMISEMDFDSPAYAAQRANPALFSLLRATEPYLDEYADGCAEMRDYLVELFESVKIDAATGRHYALVATKQAKNKEQENMAGTMEDRRFNPDGTYKNDDTHLNLWENKSS